MMAVMSFEAMCRVGQDKNSDRSCIRCEVQLRGISRYDLSLRALTMRMDDCRKEVASTCQVAKMQQGEDRRGSVRVFKNADHVRGSADSANRDTADNVHRDGFPNLWNPARSPRALRPSERGQKRAFVDDMQRSWRDA
jgi:hypothetical protein